MDIRLAREEDIEALAALYDAVNDHLAATVNWPGWRKGIYPTREDAQAGVAEGTLYVAEDRGVLAGSLILNQKQEEAYAEGRWSIACRPEEVLVVHTFLVHPAWLGKSLGKELLRFAAHHGREQGMRVIRLDTYVGNMPARKLYEKCGYRYAGEVDLGLGHRGLEAFSIYELAL